MTEKEQNRKVIKTVPVRDEWKTKHGEMYNLGKQLKQDEGRLHALRKAFWAEVELALNDYSDMRYNPKTNEIEILDDGEEHDMGGLVKSPFQMGVKE